MKKGDLISILFAGFALLLSACSDGDSNSSSTENDSPGSGNASLREVAPATLDDEGKALMHAALAIAVFGPEPEDTEDSTANGRQTQASRLLRDSRVIANQETTQCNGGGQLTDLGSEERGLDSPYTESNYNVSMEESEDCVVDAGDFQSLTDGYYESGFPVGGDFRTLYQLQGRDIEDPYRWRLGTPPGSETPDFLNWLGVWLLHSQQDTENPDVGSSYQYQVVLTEVVDAEGAVLVLTQFGTSPAQEDLFHYSINEVDGFSIDQRYLSTYDGVFGAEIFEPQIPDECQFGRLHFETVEQVLVEVMPVVDGTEYRFIDGQLLLTDEAGNTAEIEYDNDSMMVSLNDGPQQTFTREQLNAREAACDGGT